MVGSEQSIGEPTMRRFIVIAASTFLFATTVIAPARAESSAVSHVQVIAIGAGAIVGVIAANIISGGMITPILTGAAVGMPADAAAAAAGVVEAATDASVLAQAGIIIVGGAVGAAVGNWLSSGY
jgi:hypothetical protein